MELVNALRDNLPNEWNLVLAFFENVFLEKVKSLRKEIDNNKLKAEIEIDGGINFENAKIAKNAGVNILVSGTTIFKSNNGNLKKNIELLKNS